MNAITPFNCRYRWIIIAIVTVLVASCGFHLRGNYDFSFSSLYLDFPANSQTASILKRQIEGMNLTQIVDTPKEAEVIVSAISEKKTNESLTYNIAGRVRERALYYDLEYTIKTARGKTLLEPIKVSLRRTMVYDDSDALSREYERDLLFKDMQSDTAQRILRKLASIKLSAEDRKTNTDFSSLSTPDPTLE